MAVGETVRQFYNTTPFPDYELSRFSTKEDLRLAASQFAKVLDRSIPKNASIIDVGTGTGQLSAFLSLRRKNVWGIDFSDSSLSKALHLKEKLKLDSWTLKRVDIMNAKQLSDIKMKFDYVLCLGVLHHTENAYAAFTNILKLLKPNGCIAVGLYNTFGRIPLKVRKLLAKTVFKNNTAIKNMFIKMQIGSVNDKERARGWWNDQYEHPHETSHTVGEVLKWFHNNDISYCGAVPSLIPFDQSNLDIKGVWNDVNEVYPYLPIRMYKQLAWVVKTHHEGGYWIMFGKKK